MPYVCHSTVAIIGAGPYGVSVAAHLRSAGIDFRIFGKPMQRWRYQMPAGMFLKSEARASNLSDPAGNYTLARYCADNRLPYRDIDDPVPLALFSEYALWFQRSLVPNIEEVTVTELDASAGEFTLVLSDGSRMRASHVVVATGLDHAAFVPTILSSLPVELVSHSTSHHDLGRFRAKDVTVIGGGQSALETAALLREQGATVRLLVRKPYLKWNGIPRTGLRSTYQRLRYPGSGLGEGLRLWFYANAPMLFRRLPRQIRSERARLELGPSGAWWLRDRILGHVEILLDQTICSADASGSQALLTQRDGQSADIATDHVIAATGYKFDLRRLPFLGRDLKTMVRTSEQQPVLGSGFESSVRGLYFTGLASAPSFGPAMRFLHGTDYTARSVCHQISISSRRSVAPVGPSFDRDEQSQTMSPERATHELTPST